MKILILILLTCSVAHSQCPVGESYVIVPKYTKTKIVSGCWPDTLIGQLWELFNMEKCLDGTSFEMGNNILHDHQQSWDSITHSCKIKDTYERRIKVKKKYKWVGITKDQYLVLCDCTGDPSEYTWRISGQY